MNILLMRFDAPLLAFGGTIVDAKNVTDDMPARSMITGLFGNALGYAHADTGALARLQERLCIASRCDVEGTHLVDFHTVDLGQPFMAQGWTTWGVPEGREGGSAASGTHIRRREYLADAIYTVAVAFEPADESPSVDELALALDEPARPLFLGRKACLPSVPISLGVVEEESLVAALAKAKLGRRKGHAFGSWGNTDDGTRRVRCARAFADGMPANAVERAVTEDRDWPNQVHVGRTIVLEGSIACVPETAEEPS